MKRSWAAVILAFVMALIGITLTIGGGLLLSLGGSPYYLIAGLAMLASPMAPWKGAPLRVASRSCRASAAPAV